VTKELSSNEPTMPAYAPPSAFQKAAWKTIGIIVLAHTVFWFAYLVVASYGFESSFPLSNVIMRWEERDAVKFLSPVTAEGPAGAKVRSFVPGRQRFDLQPDSRDVWAFSLNSSGPYALAIEPAPGMKIHPVLTLLDQRGKPLTDNRSSNSRWTPRHPDRPRFYSKSGSVRDHWTELREKSNSYGRGMVATLTAGETYFLRVSPGPDQDLTYAVSNGKQTMQKPNQFGLSIEPFRPESYAGLIPISLFLGPPALFLFMLFRSFMIEIKKGWGKGALKETVEKRASEFESRVQEKKDGGNPEDQTG